MLVAPAARLQQDVGVPTINPSQEWTCRVVLRERDRSFGNGVFVDDAVLHDDQKFVCGVSNEVDIFQRIAVDD
jgi:hypothetical protein